MLSTLRLSTVFLHQYLTNEEHQRRGKGLFVFVLSSYIHLRASSPLCTYLVPRYLDLEPTFQIDVLKSPRIWLKNITTHMTGRVLTKKNMLVSILSLFSLSKRILQKSFPQIKRPFFVCKSPQLQPLADALMWWRTVVRFQRLLPLSNWLSPC